MEKNKLYHLYISENEQIDVVCSSGDKYNRIYKCRTIGDDKPITVERITYGHYVVGKAKKMCGIMDIDRIPAIILKKAAIELITAMSDTSLCEISVSYDTIEILAFNEAQNGIVLSRTIYNFTDHNAFVQAIQGWKKAVAAPTLADLLKIIPKIPNT
jgi:hypothetical protein